MRTVILIGAGAALVAVALLIPSDRPRPPAPSAPDGPIFLLQGCEKGVPELGEVNLWDSADRRRVVGRAIASGFRGPGMGPCDGEPVQVLETATREGLTLYRVLVVRSGMRGWVSELFRGRDLSRPQCRELFRLEEQRARCGE